MPIESQYGQNEFSDQIVVEENRVYDYTYSDLDVSAHTLKIPLLPGTLVKNVAHLVTTAFSGGSPAITIGDGDDADGYGAAGAFTPGSAGNFAQSVAGSAALVNGKYYPNGGYILVTHAASLAAGAGKVVITSLPLKGNWRVPDPG